MAKARLDAEGIPVFVAEEYRVNMQWRYSNALGGVKVQVLLRFAKQAKTILAQDYSALLKDEFGKEQVVCPKCASTDIGPFTRGKRPAFVVLLLPGFPLFLYRHGTRCKSCGHFSRT
ncbi:DUF2007 domain-containing protein [Amphritea pacifica]|uniref:DUF2007 domain-containing protein n=1 Tax=Amphritea pacifica TaxID=2811233 RepID=A0ABS2WB22_9GAMM|nr:DUF2007 domain-containing protein [Amphritea pacifica]MBN0988921.1 DUF2007 domain-containing protein [Amphritea pacifica]